MADMLERYKGKQKPSMEDGEGTPQRRPQNAPIIGDGVSLFSKPDIETAATHHHLWVDVFAPFDSTIKHMMMDRLLGAGPVDKLTVRINSGGGSIDEGVRLMNAIDTCFKGRTTSIIDSKAYSMGAMLFCKGDKRVVHPFSSFMFHNYASIVMGKGGEIKDRVGHMGEMGEKYFQNILENGWISQSEYQSMLDGKDLWMKAEDLLERGIATHIALGEFHIPAEQYLSTAHTATNNVMFQEMVQDLKNNAIMES